LLVPDSTALDGVGDQIPITDRELPVAAEASSAPVTHHQSPITQPSKFPPAILLLGPTASGKTAVAAALAAHLPCEIISVDSAQVYKGMDVGTAKPDARTLAQAPHHLIDVIEPHERYSAARFRDDALTLMREITERDRIPLLVGGTMLYFQALTEGLNDLPEADHAVRLVIDTMAEEEGWPAVHEKLARVDPETAARLAPNDAQRIQRAMEIYMLTGKPMAELLKKPKYVYFPYTPIKVALIPSDRAELHRRIETRFDEMLRLGLPDELRKLREEYGLEPGMPSMRCVGYRQAWDYLDGRIGAAALREQGIAATRQLAKRQLTWLRSMDDVTEFDCLASDLPDMVLEYIRRELEALIAAG
jgi:tRNA dimethylallyltransferase